MLPRTVDSTHPRTHSAGSERDPLRALLSPSFATTARTDLSRRLASVCARMRSLALLVACGAASISRVLGRPTLDPLLHDRLSPRQVEEDGCASLAAQMVEAGNRSEWCASVTHSPNLVDTRPVPEHLREISKRGVVANGDMTLRQSRRRPAC